jgi:hypothetical protein
LITAVVDSNAVIVQPSSAIKQMDEENPDQSPQPPEREDEGGEGGARSPDGEYPELPVVKKIKRFYGHVTLDPMRAGRDAGKISEEVVQHMLGLVGSEAPLRRNIPSKAAYNVFLSGREALRCRKIHRQSRFEEHVRRPRDEVVLLKAILQTLKKQ